MIFKCNSNIYNTDNIAEIKVKSNKDYQLNDYPTVVGILGNGSEITIMTFPYKYYPWDNGINRFEEAQNIVDRIYNAIVNKNHCMEL